MRWTAHTRALLSEQNRTEDSILVYYRPATSSAFLCLCLTVVDGCAPLPCGSAVSSSSSSS
eukprot:m.64472 g.64472  ORF g.64472 m.64472 type:complete len:61 (+) comp13495_c0_seq1:949-1131(+)